MSGAKGDALGRTRRLTNDLAGNLNRLRSDYGGGIAFDRRTPIAPDEDFCERAVSGTGRAHGDRPKAGHERGDQHDHAEREGSASPSQEVHAVGSPRGLGYSAAPARARPFIRVAARSS